MKARIRQFLGGLAEKFWMLPGLMVLAGVALAIILVHIDRSDIVPRWLLAGPWLYNGGGTGARTLLGAVAGSMIGVAGTVFSITIAALSLAAGQMGPRLLRNFTRDRGNQFTLGAFLGTFSYALMVLRSVRSQSEGEFVPHLSLSVGLCWPSSASEHWSISSDIWPTASTWIRSSNWSARTCASLVEAADDRGARQPPARRLSSGAAPSRLPTARRGYLQQTRRRGSGRLGA